MKNFKAVTAVLASILSVGSIYTFSCLLVERVDDVDLSAESFYSATSTETTTATTEEETLGTVDSFIQTYRSTKSSTTTSQTEDTTKETTAETTIESTTEETTAETTIKTTVETTAETTVPTTAIKEETSTKTVATTVATTTAPKPTETEIIVVEDYSETTVATTVEDKTSPVFGTLPTNYNPFYQASISASIAELETSKNAETDPEFVNTTTKETSVASVLDFKDETTTATTTSAPSNSSATNAVSSFTVKINGQLKSIDAYTLVCQIVNVEMGSSFNTEALKAQAIASYSYLKNYSDRGSIPSVLVKSNPSQKIKDAVSEVFGTACYYNGSVAQTTYYASSSGYTASAKSVWGAYYPYLASVRCEFDEVSDPNYGDTKSFSESTIRNALERSLGITLSDDPSQWLTVTSYCDGNFVDDINVDGQKNISGRKLRETVLNYNLKSAAFDVYYADGVFVFTTYGYGHGVGMSQNGANILAKQGYTYKEILNHYYTGIEIL